MGERVRIRFSEPDREGVEADIGLALFTAECLHGRPRTRMDVRYFLAEDGRVAVIAAEGPAGETELRVLVGLIGARFGEDRFRVEHIQQDNGP